MSIFIDKNLFIVPLFLDFKVSVMIKFTYNFNTFIKIIL